MSKEMKQNGEKSTEVSEKKNRKWLRWVFWALILGFSIVYYMRFIEPTMLFVSESKLESSYLPESLSGLKVVHFSDLHYKMTTEEKELQKLAKKIGAIKPDILVFTGDLLDETVYYTNRDYEELTNVLSKMSAAIGKYYVKGEHDYASEKAVEILESSGFTSLNNTYEYIYGDADEKILLNGLGSFLKDDFDVHGAFDGVDNNLFTITLFHEPDNILELRDQHIDLALAGHSHNNQIAIPILSDFFLVEGAKSYYHQYYLVGNTHLYVNSGIGTNHVRYRLFSPPTVNLYRLVKS